MAQGVSLQMTSLEKFIKKNNRKKINFFGGIVVLGFVLGYLVEFDIFSFIDGLPSMLNLLGRILRPNLSYSEVIWKALIDTIEMSIVGSFLGVSLSLPFILLTATNIAVSKVLASFLNKVFSVFRTIPSLIWAAILVSVFSIGKFSGTIALTIIALLISQKLLKERVEEISENELNATISVGANRLQLMKYSILPKLRKHAVSTFFIVLESNIRSATILGFVGAGGIGQLMWRDLNHMRYDNLATMIMILFFLILGIDFLSLFMRREKKIIRYRVKTLFGYKCIKIFRKIIFFLSIYLVLIILRKHFTISFERLLLGLSQGKVIVVRMCHLNLEYIPKTLVGIYESFAIAMFATFMSGILGIVLSYFAASNSSPNKYVSFMFKALINIMRTVPPMIVAIIFFRGVGPGKLSGALALTVYTTGTLTKMYSEVIENVNENVIDSIKSTGASKISIYSSGLIRETFPTFVGILLYRMESNVRNSTVLGVIGAGGVGMLLNMNIIWRNWENVGVMVLSIGLMIGVMDAISRAVRMRIK